MKYSNIIAVVITALLLTACGASGDGGLVPDCLFCFPAAPPATVTVNAGPDRTVTDGDAVELAGSAIHSRNWILSHKWNQMSGPPVTIIGSGFAIADFVAPSVSNATSLTFRLTATTVTVDTPPVSGQDEVTILVQPTSAFALCLQAPLFAVSYAWSNNGCTTDSADIAGDSRIATVYRQGEAEPNDSSQSANPLTFPMRIATERVATDVAGSVSGVGKDREDFYIFTPPVAGVFEIYLCNDPLVCVRGTVSEKWFLSLRNQDLDVIAGTTRGRLNEQVVRFQLEAGLPYYVGIHGQDPTSIRWEYNLTILSGSN